MYDRQPDFETIEHDDPDFAPLPAPVQRQIVEKLIDAHRLPPLDGGAVPMLRFRSEAAFQTGQGRMIRRVTVESRTTVDDKPKVHTSRFVIYSTGVVDLRL